MKQKVVTDKIVVGGLHRDDFEWACGQYESAGYVLASFELDIDGYHWRAVYAQADTLEKDY